MRDLLSVTGADRVGFLQGLLTNDVTRAPCYAAMLTPQGKLIVDLFVIPAEDRFILDLPEGQGEAMARRLSMYKLRADVAIAPEPGGVRLGAGAPPEGALADPRHPALGWRLYGQGMGDDLPDRAALRVRHLIPEFGAELIANESYILEMGFVRLNGVDFRKGCYVGQEVTARMRHKTELRKGLARVSLSAPVASGATITDPRGREVGVVHTVSGEQALAYIRFDRAAEGMEAQGATLRLEETAP